MKIGYDETEAVQRFRKEKKMMSQRGMRKCLIE